MLIAWSDEAEDQDLAGEVAGYAGSTAIGTDDSGAARYVSGTVVLDRKDFVEIIQEDKGRSIAKSIVLHEFGHLVGLDHVEDTGELMFESTSDVAGFGPGDRQGLAVLGAGACFP